MLASIGNAKPIAATEFTVNAIGKTTATGTINTSAQMMFNLPSDYQNVGAAFNFTFVTTE